MIARALLLILCAGFGASFAKNAEDYFHDASYKYVEGKRQDARLEVEEGLRRFPDDARLRSLAGQLKDLDDKQKPPSGGDGQDKNKDKDKKDKDPKKDPGKNGDKDQDKKDPGKDKGDQKEPPRDNPSDRDGKDGKDGKTPPGGRPGEMNKEEAQRLLNSFAEDEKKEQRERQKLMLKRLETEQDW